MERYSVWEGHMDDLMKKVNKIQNKCRKFGCNFHFAQVGEEIKEVPDYTTLNPVTGKPIIRNCKFIIVEAEGTAVINGWEFVASVEHTEKGNIFSKALIDVEIPERYRCSDPFCEHCNSNRMRKNTCIVRNTETGEFKQVGNSCLKDFTFGMSASFAVYLASIKDIFKEAEEQAIGSSCGWGQRYFDTKEVLQFTAETIRHFGFSRSDNHGDSTKERMIDFFNVYNGNTRWIPEDEIRRITNQMKAVGFNPDSEEAVKMTEDALNWINSQEATNDYMHNLKTVCSLDYTTYHRFGLLVSLFPTFDRELEIQAKRKAEMEAGKVSDYVGQVGDRVDVQIASVKCITSWESCFNGYSTTTTYVWKITDVNGNIFTWKTSKWMDEENPPASMKGTVKEHKMFREVKQTELTRCKVA